MKRKNISNTIIILFVMGIFPVYPAFGSVLYDISGGVRNFEIDEASILETTLDDPKADSLSADMPVEARRDWSGRTEIESYVVQDGDTLAVLARDYGISMSTLRWVNNLSSNVLKTGQKLIIPPGNGIIYTTKTGDTLETIAKQYNLTNDTILTNNQNISRDIAVGTLLYLPGVQPVIVDEGSGERQGISGKYELTVVNPGGKGFVPGHCTYFVAKHWNVNWRGHAKDWFKNAQKAGYKTGQTARPGSVIVWYGPGYNLTYGHVGLVMSVDTEKGTMVVKDMNYTGLWKITTRTEKIKNKYILGFIYDEKK